MSAPPTLWAAMLFCGIDFLPACAPPLPHGSPPCPRPCGSPPRPPGPAPAPVPGEKHGTITLYGTRELVRQVWGLLLSW
jgi:hypothetical protein